MTTPNDDVNKSLSKEVDSKEEEMKIIDKPTEKKEKKKKKKIHKLSLEETEDFNAKLKKRGVVYIARIPPRMGPTKAKALLGEFGVITRIYLEEEDKAQRKRRQRASGSSGGKRYTEGWVEYESKKVAKRVALALNNTPITNHKRNVHYGDMWSLRYLSKFQWAHLTEKVAFERRIREQKLKIEMMQARKENQAYSTLVEAGKTMDRIDERRRKREAKEGTDNGGDSKKQKLGEKRPARKFRQNKPIGDQSDKAAKAAILNSLV
jgi:ESF2/ABP1 family protein